MARAKRKQHHSTHHSASRNHSTRNRDGGEEVRHGAEQMMSAGQTSARSAFDIFSGPMARIMGHNWSLFHKVVQAMQEESLRFFNRRLEHTSHIIENSRDFHGVGGLMQLQQEWLLDCARDYSEQATRFAQLVRELAADSTERFAEASVALESEIENAEEEYEEEPHRAAA
jgi:hypothetical protein